MNISNKRLTHQDMYKIYDCSKAERGKYLNTWFWEVWDNGKSKKKNIPQLNSIITFKKVDIWTGCRLYDRLYNPVSIFINIDYRNHKKYVMKAMIHSIDDSSFGIWFDNKTYDELVKIRINIMKYIDAKQVLNGEEFLKYCVELGGDNIDYN